MASRCLDRVTQSRDFLSRAGAFSFACAFVARLDFVTAASGFRRLLWVIHKTQFEQEGEALLGVAS